MHNLFIYHPIVPEMGQRTDLKRTGVQIMPRAIPCTSSDDLGNYRGSLGAFALLVVSALNLGGFV